MKKFLAILTVLVLILVVPCAAVGETKTTPSLVLTAVVTAAKESNDTSIVKLTDDSTDVCLLQYTEKTGVIINIPGLGIYMVSDNKASVFATAIVALVAMCGMDDYGVTWGVAYEDSVWTEAQVILMAAETAKTLDNGD